MFSLFWLTDIHHKRFTFTLSLNHCALFRYPLDKQLFFVPSRNHCFDPCRGKRTTVQKERDVDVRQQWLSIFIVSHCTDSSLWMSTFTHSDRTFLLPCSLSSLIQPSFHFIYKHLPPLFFQLWFLLPSFHSSPSLPASSHCSWVLGLFCLGELPSSLLAFLPSSNNHGAALVIGNKNFPILNCSRAKTGQWFVYVWVWQREWEGTRERGNKRASKRERD